MSYDDYLTSLVAESRFGAGSKVLYAQGSSYVAGFPVIIPRTVFKTGSDAGLKGEYFSNAGLQGQPVLLSRHPWSGQP